MAKPPQEERSVILQKAVKRPYGVKLILRTITAGTLGNLADTCISMQSGTILRFKEADSAPWQGGYGLEARLEGFPTPAASEDAGRRLVQAFLWTAISKRTSIQLTYQSYEPVYVFERNRGPSLEVKAYSDVLANSKAVTDELHHYFFELPDPVDSVLLSMEIFAGARLESSERAAYLAMVSALEPLAAAQSLGQEVGAFVDQCIQSLKEKDCIDSAVKASLRGRLAYLKSESIRGALKRLVQERLPNSSAAWNVVDEAYALRSEIVHTGKPSDLDTDIQEKSKDLEDVVMDLYRSYMSTSS
ncbi:hypothetical protein [Thiococcus pfennigii]|uniref:hypothetical protein n=1 Tax=Thiococcus pfennigii TaxID=1057 RepID=UPI001904E86D|nr:hypothetical protein [Thiococcus pfennigii]